MKNKTIHILSVFALFLLITACGGKTESENNTSSAAETESNGAANTPAGGLMEAAKSLEQAAQQMQEQGGEMKEPVDFRALKELLPSSVNGMPLSDASGEKTGMMGFKMSTAKGKYSKGDNRVDLSIVDFGGVTGALSMIAAWTMVDIDKENDQGYERTTTYKGFKGFEKYDNQNKDGQLAVLVGNRFMVTADGSNVDMAVIRKAIDALNLQKLQGIQ